MGFTKQLKDQLIRLIAGTDTVPRGLRELEHYFRCYGPIEFRYDEQDDGTFVAVSQGFRHGSIVTSGRTPTELEANIKDAILTSFEVPSSYAHEANVQRVGNQKSRYAFA